MTCAIDIPRDIKIETRASATNIDLTTYQANVGGDSQGNQRIHVTSAIQRCPSRATGSGMALAPTHRHNRMN